MGKLRGLYILKVDGVVIPCEYEGDEVDSEAIETTVADDGSQHQSYTPKPSTLDVNVLETDDLTREQLEAVYRLRGGRVDFDYGNGHSIVLTAAYASPGKKTREGKRPVTFTGRGDRA